MKKIMKKNKNQMGCGILAILLSTSMGITTLLSNPLVVYAVEDTTTEETGKDMAKESDKGEDGNEKAADTDQTITETVKIESAQDLKTIATNSVNDTYTLHKKFVLHKDIDLAGSDYQPIAIFAGELDGNGHTIKGLKLNNFGANSGLIQYVEETGTVSNLTVEGDILQTEKKENIGGIVGTNKGTIRNCTFMGKVIAQQCVGGIVGYNKETGKILSCNNESMVIGTKRTGGIAGKNEGTVENCTNQGDINATDQTVYDFGEADTTDFSMPDFSADKEQIKKDMQDEKKINYIGGIAGVSSGIVTGCENFATVGHEHMGYTIGGIVGYERGILTNSNNYGLIHGRKDIGGIVGILEPLVEVDYSEDTTQKLQDQMNDMLDLMDGLSDKTRAGGDTATDNVDQVRDSVKDMRQIIRNHKDYYDKRVDVFDEGLDSRVNSIDQIIEELDFNIDDAKVRDALGALRSDSEKLSGLLLKMQTYQAGISADQLYLILAQLGVMPTSVEGEAATTPTALMAESMVSTVSDNALEDQNQKVDENLTVDNKTDDATTVEENKNTVVTETENNTVTKSGETNYQSADYQVYMNEGSSLTPQQQIVMLAGDAKSKFNEMEKLLPQIETLLKDMSKQGAILSHSMTELNEEKTEFKEDIDDLDDHLDELRFFLRSQRDSLKKDLDKTDDEITAQSDHISALMDQLSNDLKSAKADIRSQMDLITAQMHLLNDTMAQGMDELREDLNKDWDEEDLIEDISDTDDKTPTTGKVIACKNEGKITSDMNGGGIAGSMMVVTDAETDFELVKNGDRSLKENKKETAVIMDCKNLSDITVRNDYAGGIVGRSEVGAVVSSENYGNVETTDGDYAGGIAGKSTYLIRNSYSLCDILGNDYAGGISGYGTDVKNNVAMAGIQNAEGGSKGTIAGDIDEDGNVEGNYFVEEGTGAIAGLSYENQATPLKYEELIAMEGIPSEFHTFQVKFVVDNKVVKKITCKYGDHISLEDYPEVPVKDGEVGFWENVDLSNINRNKTVHGIYDTWTTTIASDEKIPVLLLSGDFYKDTVLQYHKEQDHNIQIPGYVASDVYTFSIASQNTLPTGAMKVRVLADDYHKNVSIAVYEGNQYVPVATQRDGRYLVFIMNGAGKFAVITKDHSIRNICVILLVVIIIGAAVILHKKKKQLESANQEMDEKEDTQEKENHIQQQNDRKSDQKVK